MSDVLGVRRLIARKDRLWLGIWMIGMALLFFWDALFLNAPAFERLQLATLHTFLAGGAVLVLALFLGWSAGVGTHFMERKGWGWLLLPVTFLLNLIRSVPQIVGILLGYIVLTLFIARGTLVDPTAQILWMAFVISLFVFLEVADLVRERIVYFERLDFVQAMLCCGIPERRIVNVEILYKNSRAHLLHKMIALFGTTIFLQCSIDFIVSVGLSTDVSLSNFPVTLGSLLAKMDSKQDILAIGNIFTDPGYVRLLFIQHLQGISVAFVIVFTLLCIYKIANGFVRRHGL